jgi:hypothetical protein
MRPGQSQAGMKIEIFSTFTWDWYEYHKSFNLFTLPAIFSIYSAFGSMDSRGRCEMWLCLQKICWLSKSFFIDFFTGSWDTTGEVYCFYLHIILGRMTLYIFGIIQCRDGTGYGREEGGSHRPFGWPPALPLAGCRVLLMVRVVGVQILSY